MRSSVEEFQNKLESNGWRAMLLVWVTCQLFALASRGLRVDTCGDTLPREQQVTLAAERYTPRAGSGGNQQGGCEALWEHQGGSRRAPCITQTRKGTGDLSPPEAELCPTERRTSL